MDYINKYLGTKNDNYLTNAENNRLTVFPIKNQQIWDAYKTQVACFWTAEELDFSRDYDDFIKLKPEEQHFIKMILAFFSSSDTIVNLNIGERFINDVKVREAIIAYDFQKMMENIHSEVYSLQIDNIVRDKDEKQKLFDAIYEFPSIKGKAEWALKWIESDKSFAHRLVAFAIVEGVFFSGAFCSIFWIKKRNIMAGLCESNQLISRDEGLHTSFAVLLYSMIEDKVSNDEIKSIFTEAVDIEKKFITESLPCDLLGMNSKLMSQYIEYVADRLLLELGYDKIYNVENPFDFMEQISIEGKTNFFETRVTQYQKASVKNKTTDKNQIFNITDDF